MLLMVINEFRRRQSLPKHCTCILYYIHYDEKSQRAHLDIGKKNQVNSEWAE